VGEPPNEGTLALSAMASPDQAVGHERLLPHADPCEDDQHYGDEQHDHHDGHNLDARRRRLM
jgi:hypothetical protein